MKKLLLTGALIGAALAPIAAQAQDYGHNRGDRHEGRDQHYDRDHRDGRDQHYDRDHHDGRHEGWRDRGHDRARGGGYGNRGWNAPFAYRSFGIGAVVPGGYYESRYYENDCRRHRLPAPRYGYYRYVRHYGDLLLINTRNGRVERVYRGYYR